MSPTTDSPAADSSWPAADDRASSPAGIARARARWLTRTTTPSVAALSWNASAAPHRLLHPAEPPRQPFTPSTTRDVPTGAGIHLGRPAQPDRRLITAVASHAAGRPWDIDRRRSSGRHGRESLGAPARPAVQTTRAGPGPPGQRTDEELVGDLISRPMGATGASPTTTHWLPPTGTMRQRSVVEAPRTTEPVAPAPETPGAPGPHADRGRRTTPRLHGLPHSFARSNPASRRGRGICLPRYYSVPGRCRVQSA